MDKIKKQAKSQTGSGSTKQTKSKLGTYDYIFIIGVITMTIVSIGTILINAGQV